MIEAAVCMANGDGGLVLVGVEDDGTITGARARHGHGTDPRRVEALIANRTTPALAVRCEVVHLPEGEILVVSVPNAVTPVGTADGRYVRRITTGRGEPGCAPMHFHEMQSRQASRGALDYSALELPGATWDDIDPLEIERFRRLARESGGRGDAALLGLSDLELAKSLGVVDANHDVRSLRVAALLLFGREESLKRLVPTHEVAFQEMIGSAVGVNDFFTWPLPRVIEELIGRFRARVREEEVLVDAVRVRVPDYSSVAFREAVANALVHRDYVERGAVHVQWKRESIEIGNPGGFPLGVRPENLLVTQPRPRNPLLADAFKRAGLVERTGRGVDVMFEEQLRFGRAAPDYSRTTRESVVVELRDGPADGAVVRLVIKQEERGQPLRLEELLVLNHLRTAEAVQPASAARLIQRDEGAALGRLRQMVAQGLLVERAGGREGPVFRLAPGVLADPVVSIVAPSGVADELVLERARARGAVSRAEVVELTGLSSDQAKRLLTRLAREGWLERRGQGRAVHYAPRSPS
jgi:ATP-dependent DNA helicase RecG